MAFDLASVVGSAAVSGAVALATASWKVGREERGKRVAAAKARIRAAATELVRQVLERRQDPKGQAGARASNGVGRYKFASEIVLASEDLAWLRRWLVRRRVRRIVGRAVFETAEIAPDRADDEIARRLLVTMLARRKDKRFSDPGRLTSLDDEHVPSDGELQVIIRSLRWVRWCW